MNKEQFEHILRELKSGKGDIRPADVVTFSEPLCSALGQTMRLGRISLTDFSELLDSEREQARQILAILVQRHLLYLSTFTSSTDTFYETKLSASTRPVMMMRPRYSEKLNE